MRPLSLPSSFVLTVPFQTVLFFPSHKFSLPIPLSSTTHNVGRLNKNSVLYTSYAMGAEVFFPYIGSCSITLPGTAGTFVYEFGHYDVTTYSPPLSMLNDMTFEVQFIEGSGYASGIAVTALKCIV